MTVEISKFEKYGFKETKEKGNFVIDLNYSEGKHKFYNETMFIGADDKEILFSLPTYMKVSNSEENIKKLQQINSTLSELSNDPVCKNWFGKE